MISANQHTVAEVLGDKFLHEIPPYQRPYAWTEDESLQLLEDIESAFQSSSLEPYFLGSIVLIRLPNELVGQVVDGQQRLTTITILAAVLRDLAESQKEKDALSKAVFIEPNRFEAQIEAIRLRPHAEDRVFFREAIQTPGATAAQSPAHASATEAQVNMWKNATALRSRISTFEKGKRENLVAFLLTKCVVVVVATESRAAALRIFRVLNDRGLDLSNADIIKADLLEKFSEQAELGHQAAKWRSFETDLGRDDFEALLDHLRFIKERGKNRRTLSEAYADRFAKANAEDVRTFLSAELAPAKNWYADITDGNGTAFPEEVRSSANEALAGLRLIPNKDWMAAALAVAIKQGPTSATVEIFQKLEALAWIMQLGRRYDTQRMNRYAEIIIALGVGPEALAAALLPTLKEQSDALTALDGPLYQTFPVRVVRALLERLDRLLAEQPVLWDGQVTVEHILPQTPSAGAWGAIPPESREAITHRLGNLVLLTKRKNSSASNFSFKEKCSVYFGLGKSQKRATYASVQELSHISDWNEIAFHERHKRHFDRLASRWGIAPGS